MEATDQDIEEWNEVFQELIQEVKPWHTWTLVTDKDLLPDAPQQGWSQYQQKTFARFQCSSCARSWASAHVQVLFHMHWNRKKHRGRVKMRVFSQRCRRCAQPRFEAAEFTLENIRRTLTNLVFRILRKCYKEGFEAMEDMPTVKDTSLEGPHDSLNCEACLQGFCAQSGLSLAPQRSGLPSLPSPSEDTRATATCSHRPCSPPPKVDKLLVSAVDSKLPKADPKVSHASKPSAAPRYPTEEVLPTLAVTPKVSKLPKADPKVSHASKPSAALRYPTEEVLPTLTVTPKVSKLPKADPKVSHASKPLDTLRISTEEVLSTLIVTPKVSNPPKADPKVSHTSKPSAALRYPTEEVSPTLTVTPKVSKLPKADPKVSHASKPLDTLRISTEEVLPTLIVTPKVSKLPKADPKVSHASKPSAAPRYPTEEVLPTLAVTPKVSKLPKADPKVSHGSKPLDTLRISTEEVLSTLIVTPKVSYPPKADPKVSHASKPSAAPRYPTEEVSPTLTVTPKVPNPLRADPKVRDWLAIHMPSPTDSRTAVDTAVGNPRVMSREPSPALPLPANSRWDRGLSSSNQTRPPICQANTRVPTPPLPESCDCSPLQSCTPVHLCLRCPCCLLLVLIIGVVLWYWLP
ncbi:receptor-transporting protein 3 [Fukomys damarensis]|uniref:Receptor-transporting protein 3 n=1 Tax=Fukomys damarensis TaxID=885580 RepID=A0A091DQC7_FUKDA|nr:receptor-transporting protein 3 [Fukomys damarensis]KFO33252.1 Receptor-transporting protein 3 [Fukomys damarensis]